MAYYTIAHRLERGSVTAGERKGVDAKDLTDAFFDHVLLGKGTAKDAAKGSITAELVADCRREFLYWYPLDYRNSGKDLVQNHLTFMVFNHVAIWPDQPDRWPRSISVNGWVNVDGEKMSKSRGNFVTLRDALDRFGSSATRLALVNAGEGLDDANFEMEFARQSAGRLLSWLDFIKERPPTTEARGFAEKWFQSVMNRIVHDAGAAMEDASFRTALKLSLFDLSREYAWYLRRCGGKPDSGLLAGLKDMQTRLLAPLVPHVAEEAWHELKGAGLVIDASYPTPDESLIDNDAERAEALVRSVLEDVREILKVTGKSPTRVELMIAPGWKRLLAKTAAKSVLSTGRPDVGLIIKEALANPALKPHAAEIPKVAGQIGKEFSKMGKAEIESRLKAVDEAAILADARQFLEVELKAAVGVIEAEKASAAAAQKAKFALPGRPAIYVE
jgi:leucyl-tRNA synthetase